MNDGTVVESPHNAGPRPSESRDALLRLPIQPEEARVHGEVLSPRTPISPNSGLGLNTVNSAPPARSNSRKVGSDPNRWVTYAMDARADDYNHQSRRFEEIGPTDPRPSFSQRGAYIEDYDDEEDRPRVYRRPVRGHTRPPPSHNQIAGPSVRMSHDQGPRRSMDTYRSYRRPSTDYDETPTKKGWYYYDGKDNGSPPYSRAYAGGGGGYKGPPRRPPSTEEVLRLPWTMWMNSNAKNRRLPSRPAPYPSLILRPTNMPQPLASFPDQPRILTIC